MKDNPKERDVNVWFRDQAESEALMKGHNSITVTESGVATGPSWFSVGYCDGQDRKTLLLIIEAARNLCGVRRKSARKLLELALKQIDPKAKDLL